MLYAGKYALNSSGIKEYKNGTVLSIFTYNGNTINIGNLVKASDSASVTIDWGDGTKNIFTDSSFSASHTYSPGLNIYLIQISDDISALKWQGSGRHQVYQIFNFGSKLMTLKYGCFQNQMFGQGYEDVCPPTYSFIQKETLFKYPYECKAYFTSFEYYSCFIPAYKVRFVNLTSFKSSGYFYCGGLSLVGHLIFDNISADGLSNASGIFKDGGWFYASTYKDLGLSDTKDITFTNKTCDQIKQMSGFPWAATDTNNWAANLNIYFHGIDGTLDKYGNKV